MIEAKEVHVELEIKSSDVIAFREKYSDVLQALTFVMCGSQVPPNEAPLVLAHMAGLVAAGVVYTGRAKDAQKLHTEIIGAVVGSYELSAAIDKANAGEFADDENAQEQRTPTPTFC